MPYYRLESKQKVQEIYDALSRATVSSWSPNALIVTNAGGGDRISTRVIYMHSHNGRTLYLRFSTSRSSSNQSLGTEEDFVNDLRPIVERRRDTA